MVITCALREFMQERNQKLDEMENKRRRLRYEENRKNAVTYEEYLKLKSGGVDLETWAIY